MISNALSFVLPVTLKENPSKLKWRTRTDQYARLRFNLLIKSFLHHFDLDGLEKFLIICPQDHIADFCNLLRNITDDNRFEIINENEICPQLSENNYPIAGWYIQQILKLAAAKYMKTNFYLTLDSDIICKKHFNYSTLMLSGKAFMNIETPLDYDDLYLKSFSTREQKIKNSRLIRSSTLLNYKRKSLYKFQSYGETPAFLHTQSVLGLLNELSSLHQDWFTVLSRFKGWSEYSLYFQYLEKHNLINKLYINTGRSTVLDLDSSVWYPSATYRKKVSFTPDYILKQENSHGYFVAIQSYLDPQDWLPENVTDMGTFYKMLEETLLQIDTP